MDPPRKRKKKSKHLENPDSDDDLLSLFENDPKSDYEHAKIIERCYKISGFEYNIDNEIDYDDDEFLAKCDKQLTEYEKKEATPLLNSDRLVSSVYEDSHASEHLCIPEQNPPHTCLNTDSVPSTSTASLHRTPLIQTEAADVQTMRTPGPNPAQQFLNTDSRPSTSTASPYTHRQGGGRVTNAINVREIPKFNAAEFRQNISLSGIDLTDVSSVPSQVHSSLTGLINTALQSTKQDSVLNVVLRGPALADDIQTVLHACDDYNVDSFLDQIAQALQSNNSSLTDDSLEFVVTVARSMSGGARCKLGSVGYDDIIQRKINSLFNPMNTGDGLCFGICLAYYANENMSKDERLDYAKRLYSELGYEHSHYVSFSDIDKFQKHLKIKIIIFHQAAGCKNPQLFKTHDETNERTAWLYLHDDHYYLIKNKTAFFGAPYVCDGCYAPYTNYLTHGCSMNCNVCQTACFRKPGNTVRCGDCKRICKSQHCLAQHKLMNAKHHFIPCDRIKYCDNCGKTYQVWKKGKKHVCKALKCTHCREDMIEPKHECYIQPLKKTPAGAKYIYYDFETRYQNDRHVANYVCSLDSSGSKYCFSGTNCVAAFVKHYRRPRYRNATFIAHNASGFDSYILLEYFVMQNICPTLIMRGSRVISMFDDNFKQRDSVALTYEGAYIKPNKTHSDVSMQWLGYLSHRESIVIQHALNGGEKTFGPYSVDGYCDVTHTGEENQTTQCCHNDRERQLAGTWVSFELQKALEKGYKIAHIDEVWHFPKKSDSLFKEYVKTFLKLKQQASGYPGNVKTEDEKKAYIENYYAREGIRLEPNKIAVNKAAVQNAMRIEQPREPPK
ncbi:uncharacterized protein LOC116675361 [Etheostoma spectabile]|uniref:uncharacterized protein LOC116675361 n=1 Tax=Etheostoma spectabile TaxID=54343 RepID=UPI0013AF66AF|nr:uncharacterized protein LOC116675361 [Etheostoma spectabile]